MAKTGGRAARARPGASSSSSPPPTRSSRPTTRSSARSSAGSTWSTGSARSATPSEQPTETVEIEQARVTSSGVIPAVVLAAGAATRYGAPKQRLLLPAVLERLARAPVDRRRRRRGRAPARRRRLAPAAVVRCPDWARGPGASLRCGLAALGDDVEGALVVLADGPQLDPRAVERCSPTASTATCVVASYDGTRGHPVGSRAPRGVDPGRGDARGRRHARRVRRPRPAGRHRLPAPAAADGG